MYVQVKVHKKKIGGILMNELIKIESKEITANEFKEQRILTAWDIAKLHEREVREVTQNFNYVKRKLILGEDYFLIARDKISESKILIQDYIPNNVKEIPIFTESGYLMLVKTFEDDLSWRIQRELVKNYFRKMNNTPKSFKEALFLAYQQAEKIEKLEAEKEKMSSELEYKTEVITGVTDNIDVYQKQKILNRVVKHKGSNFSSRWNELYTVFRETYGIDLKARRKGYDLKQIKSGDKCKSVLDYAVKFGHLDNLYNIALKLYETDMDEIIHNIKIGLN